MFAIGLYTAALILSAVSWYKNPEKTKQAFRKAWKSFENILPQLSSILLLIGFALTFISPDTISYFMGEQSGFFGLLFASLIGSITLIPGFVAFPLAAALLESGAGYMQIGAFITSLMMVGLVTLPMEIKYFGKKSAYLRNSLGFVFAFVVAIFIGGVMFL